MVSIRKIEMPHLSPEQAELSEVIDGLQYIADSPAREHGGFHPNAVKAAKAAIKLLQKWGATDDR